jgi:radical SAM protein with 4Fe4S-binding SPASM domain
MPNWVAVDVVGKEIVELSNGERTLEEVTAMLCARHNANVESSQANILQFATLLNEKDFLSTQPFSYPEVDKSAILAGNLVLWINITHRCNLRCMHCFRSAGEALENELTTAEILSLVDEAASIGCREIVISGGEPLLRDDALQILGYVKKKDVKFLKLITNGTFISKEVAKTLKEMEPIYVQVSIDGATEATADKIRGDGVFHRAIAGVKHLAEAGLTRDLVVSMTLLKTNLGEIEQFINLALDLGATGVHFPAFQAVGSGKKNWDELSLDTESMYVALKTILTMRGEYSQKITVSLTPEIVKYVKGSRRDYCGAGIGLWSVEPDGRVTPCAGLCDSQFIAGSIREQSLKEIVYESAVARQFQALRLMDNPHCSSCELRFICGGGCHVDRFSEHGKLESAWSKCEVTKLIYKDYFKSLVRNNIATRKEVTT